MNSVVPEGSQKLEYVYPRFCTKLRQLTNLHQFSIRHSLHFKSLPLGTAIAMQEQESRLKEQTDAENPESIE